MLGGEGLGTRHEYIIWRTLQSGPVYSRNAVFLQILTKARENIDNIKVYPSSEIRFSKWINANQELTGGERAI